MKLPFFISGPESTAKSTLTDELAKRFNGYAVAEYAREYVGGLERPYTYLDLCYIAKEQIQQIHNYQTKFPVFFDTDLIVTKVWFDMVFKSVPNFLLDTIQSTGKGFYLLCKPDIPWEPDPLRENKENREALYNCYRQEIINYDFPMLEVFGSGPKRLEIAVKRILEVFPELQ